MEKDLRIHARQFIQKNGSRLDNLEKVIRLLDPANVLRRGYSITHHRGKILKDVSLLRKGDFIDTILFEGVIKSIVETVKEAKEREQEQANDLFSGIDRASTDNQ
jgi:exodeoxyribonuclease VII large subunit